MQLKHFVYGLIFAFTLSSTCALAQDTSMNNNNQPNNVSNEQMQEDHNAIVLLMTLDQNEVDLAKLAIKKANTPIVKNYAKQMQKDHAQNRVSTMKIAHKIKVDTSMTVDANDLKEKGKKQITDLSTAKGKEFDQQYIDEMVKDHQAALNLVQDLAGKVNNTALKDHLNKTATAIDKHLQEAKNIQTKLNNNQYTMNETNSNDMTDSSLD